MRGNIESYSKELFSLDGRATHFTDEDRARRNAIANLLDEWGLVKLVPGPNVSDTVGVNAIKIIPFKEKPECSLVTKYNVGRK